MKYIILLIVLVLAASSCDKEIVSTKIVVQSYLSPNNPVVVKLQQVTTENSIEEIPASNADVQIIHNDVSFLLTENAEEPGCYRYIGNELDIVEGDLYQLNVFYKGQHVYAQTRIPLKPQNLQASHFEITSPPTDAFSINLSWENTTDCCFISTNCLNGENPEQKITGLINNAYTPYYLGEPYASESVSISHYVFKYYGMNVIKITSISDEYKKLYDYKETYRNDKVALETNIENGFGIFTGFSSDSVVINVKRPN